MTIPQAAATRFHMSGNKYGATLTEVFSNAARRFDGMPAFCRKDPRGVFQPTSFRELYEKGLDLATALIDLGVAAREHVAIIADNRLEWIICDYGILLAGAADVPRGTDITDGEMEYILSHSDARVVFVENASILRRVLALRPKLPNIAEIIVMAPGVEAPEGVRHLENLLADGAARRAAGIQTATERARAVRPDDLFTIIYTSGTTGTPKGVQLTHANMCSQIENLPLELRPGDRALAILPIWHSYERVFEMLCVSRASRRITRLCGPWRRI